VTFPSIKMGATFRFWSSLDAVLDMIEGVCHEMKKYLDELLEEKETD
jgi:hypothetical protein